MRLFFLCSNWYSRMCHRQINGLTDRWTSRPSYRVAKMHQEGLVYLLWQYFACKCWFPLFMTKLCMMIWFMTCFAWLLLPLIYWQGPIFTEFHKIVCGRLTDWLSWITDSVFLAIPEIEGFLFFLRTFGKVKHHLGPRVASDETYTRSKNG